ncbi:MAG: hypothetical protein E6448_04165 [Actinomyces sp.]|nr:hypothetical protein [Actinomyces sp.]
MSNESDEKMNDLTGRSDENPHTEDAFSLDSHRETSRSVYAFDDLLDSFRQFSDSERLKGNYFEQLIRAYLLNDAQMSRQFGRVYLWRDWPGGGQARRQDIGIDLVAIEHEGMPSDGSEPTATTPAVAIQRASHAHDIACITHHSNSFHYQA